MKTKLLLGASGLLVVFLLFRNCDQKVQIAHLEGELHMQEQILLTTTAEWKAAREVWLAADAESQKQIEKLQAEKDEAFGHIDSLNGQLSKLETDYAELLATGAPCPALLKNALQQIAAGKERYDILDTAYQALWVDYGRLQDTVNLCKMNDSLWAKRYEALESVNATLSKELKVAKRANLALGLQTKALKVIAIAEVVVGGYFLLKKDAAPRTTS